MTELLYFADTFLFDCTANVVRVTDSQAKGCKRTVVVDRTCMHPQGGGQPADNGYMKSDGATFRVLHVTKTPDGAIEHHGEFESGAEFQPADAVTIEVDRDRRIFNARNHTAGHLLDYALDMLDYHLVGGSGYHFPDGAYVDAVIEPPLPKDINLKEFGQRVEDKLNELVGLGLRHVPLEKPPRELPARTQALLSDFVKDSPTVRVMQLDGREDLMLPCGGTHATNTAQIGRITIRKVTYKQAKGTVKFAYAVLPNDEVEPKLVY